MTPLLKFMQDAETSVIWGGHRFFFLQAGGVRDTHRWMLCNALLNMHPVLQGSKP